jgi:hypothetical protein
VKQDADADEEGDEDQQASVVVGFAFVAHD